MRFSIHWSWASAAALTIVLMSACGDNKKKPTETTSTDAGGSGGSSTSTSTTGGAGESGETTTDGSGGSQPSGTTGGTGGGSPGGAGGEASEAWGEAGFIDIEGVTVRNVIESVGDDPVTSPTRIFYSYVPAEDPDAPVFVFAGSSVGLSTVATLAAYGVGPTTLDVDDPSSTPEENPNSWLQMGNLLFIDPRQTGFSYSTIEDPEVDENRGNEYLPLNFNPFVDAADIVRTLLRFLAGHPDQQDNPVVLVAQGDGGIRTSLMLSYLLYPDELRDSDDFIDEALADEIEEHFGHVFPDDDLDAALAAQQFGWQVLIQPYIGSVQQARSANYECLDGSVEQQIADDLGVICPPSVRDAWHIEEEPEWASGVIQSAGTVLASLDGFESLLGLDPADVEGLPASQRDGAFRETNPRGTLAVPIAADDWKAALGELELYDRYFLAENPLIAPGGDYPRNSAAPCWRFLRSIMHVNTFVTNATFDMAVRTQAIVDALEACSAAFTDNPLDSIDTAFDLEDNVDRPGWLVVDFNDAAEVGAVTRTVRWPEYPASGHAVHWSEPQALREDVQAFLSDTGLDL